MINMLHVAPINVIEYASISNVAITVVYKCPEFCVPECIYSMSGFDCVTEQISQAKELLERVETKCQKVGLQLNIKTTKYMAYNTDDRGYMPQSNQWGQT